MRFTHILAAFAVLIAAAACSLSEIDNVISTPKKDSQYLQVVGCVTQYSDKEVATRSKKEGDEPKVTSIGLALFPFNDDGTIGNCLYYDFKLGGSIVFIVDRHDNIFNNYVGKKFAMYIFANMQGAVNKQDDISFPTESEDGVGKSLDFFTKCAAAANVNVAGVPENGFPMVGSLGDILSDPDPANELILKPAQTESNLDGLPLVGGSPTDKLEIPLKSMYAKLSFTISVKPDQEIVGNKAPRFDLLSYEVTNISADVDSNSETNDDNDVIGTSGEIGMGSYAQGATTAKFYFYLPERYLSPSKTIDEVLPTELKKGTYDIAVDSDQNGYRDEDERYHQRFKNKLTEDKKATYVTIKGKYTDHQENTYDVDYNIFLGGNNRDDFNIIRNTHYDNSITIRGISASDDQALNPGAVSIDWRVNVNRSTPLVINLRRESLLDAHFEVRPLRLRLVGENIPTGTSATVQILNEDGTENEIPGWIRLEKSGSGTNYISSGVSAGKRMYFTTNLVTETLANTGKNITIENLNASNQTVWIYVDENSTNTSRASVLRVTYGGDTKDFKIVQNGLYKVTNGDREYFIEQHEEYLYNYDAEDSYGQTKQEGMPWGLNGVQLSKEHYSYDSDELTPDVAWAKYEQEAPRPYYDFYTWEQDSTILKAAGFSRTEDVCHDIAGAGRHFTEVIAENPNSDVKYITLGEQPTSAVQYCYSRNKRNSDGTVDVKWYLPSADELEDFIVPAYSTFEEFQDNYYWTSQPAYIRNIFYYEYQSSRLGGKKITRPIVYDDNTKYARATKVIYENGGYKPAKSGLNSEPTPIVDNRSRNDKGNYEIVGYFYVMHYYKRYYKSVISGVSEEYGSDKTKVQENKEAGIDVTNGDYDEWYDSKYYVHLGHLENMMQEGYQPRTKSNRVRCAYKQSN